MLEPKLTYKLSSFFSFLLSDNGKSESSLAARKLNVPFPRAYRLLHFPLLVQRTQIKIGWCAKESNTLARMYERLNFVPEVTLTIMVEGFFLIFRLAQPLPLLSVSN